VVLCGTRASEKKKGEEGRLDMAGMAMPCKLGLASLGFLWGIK
jgi:hypothetical protein